MALTARRLSRLEVWTNWQAAAGTRISAIPEILALKATTSLSSGDRLQVIVPLDAPGASDLTSRRVLRVMESDSIWDEWKIVDRSVDDERGVLGIVAAPLRATDILEAGLITRLDSDSVVLHDFETLGFTATQHIDLWVLPALVEGGLPWIARGTVTPMQRFDMAFAWDNPLSALLRIASITNSELDIRRNGTVGYYIDIVTKVNSAEATADVRVGKNLKNLVYEQSSLEQATRIFPRGAASDGLHATMGRAMWKVTAISGDILTLADPAGGAGPILVDDQFSSSTNFTNGEDNITASTVIQSGALEVGIFHTMVEKDDMTLSTTIVSGSLVV